MEIDIVTQKPLFLPMYLTYTHTLIQSKLKHLLCDVINKDVLFLKLKISQRLHL